VQKGQLEAAEALGLSRYDSLRLIILPQALRVMLPPLASQYLNLVKNSSLAAAIAFPDLVLVFSGTAINITGQAVEIMAMVMLVYLLLSLSISAVMNRYQKKTLHYLGQRS
jgi:general L-amino acid transport system permease protein